MKRILVVSAKGGVGRTTTTMLLASAFGRVGLKSGIIDFDPQGSATNWIRLCDKPTPGVEEYSKGGEYDLVWTDTQPLVDPPAKVRKSAEEADIILVITSDSPMDLHATNLTLKNLLKSPKLKKKARLLLTRVVQRTNLAKQIDEIVAGMDIQRIKPVIHFRNAYRLAPLQGFSALNRAAKDEVNEVAMALMK